VSNWLGPRGQGRRLGARHHSRRPTQDKDVDALEAIKLDECLDQGAGCVLPSSTQRSDYELAGWMPSSLSPCRRSVDAEVAAADEVVHKESQVQYIGDCDLQYAVAGSGMSAARRLLAAAAGRLLAASSTKISSTDRPDIREVDFHMLVRV